MAFSSIEFLFYFLPIFFLLYFLVPGTSGKNVVLLLASLLFYAAGEPRFVLVLMAQMALNYAAALVIAHAERFRRVATAIGVFANLLLLGVFKYAGFVVSTLNGIVHAVSRGAVASIPHPNLALPIGISFFTFHSISYLIDVYRKQVLPNRSPIQIAIYIAMFPQLIAGPIVRYHTISHLLGCRRWTLGRASAGMRIFIIGLAQKVLIADEVAKIAERVFDYTIHPTATEAWLGLGAYTLQIYFDFAGYSSMAVGLGFMLGFAFPRNFRLPYTSESITEFWRRWHISLSQWLRDYLYIPLGGSRGTNLQTYR
ncbi:MAG TPA: MBOAT family O-acyltransferase, partial [Xanthobacteraceae bacterium]